MTLNGRVNRRLQALVLILLAMFLAQKIASGTLYYYIGLRFGWLAVAAVALLIVVAGSYRLIHDQTENTADGMHHHAGGGGDTRSSAWPLLIVSVPLLLGIAVPARPLGASAVEGRGVSTVLTVSGDRPVTTLAVMPAERTILDWVQLIESTEELADLAGLQADVVGFVYHDPRLANDEFILARFTITCCVADAFAVGLVVSSPEADRYPADTWLHVEGTFYTGFVEGQPALILSAGTITPVEPPEHPYLYP